MNYKATLQFILLTFLLSLCPAWSFQETDPVEEPPSEEEVVTYVYHIPFPEKSYFDVARFRLELISLQGTDFNAQVLGHNESGTEVLREEMTSHGGASLFTWDSQSKVLTAAQSLEIIADQPLDGALWLWDDQLGFFNGVSLSNKVANGLVMPSFPADFFNWQTSFAVKGLNTNRLPADLIFAYYDDVQAFNDVQAWTGLQDRGFYRGTPFFDFQIGDLGEEPDVRWAMVHSTYDDFFITGYQSFTHFNPMTFDIRSCATEMQDTGSATGWVGFSSVEGEDFSSRFIFTNAGDEPVQVQVSLQHRVEVVSEEGEEPVEPLAEEEPAEKEYQVVSTAVMMLMVPKQSFQTTLSELFPDFEGEPVSLSYTSTTVPVAVEEGEEPIPVEPREIFALHMQDGREGSALGGHNFVPSDGGLAVSWVGMTSSHETLLEVYNTTDRFQKLDLNIYDEAGAHVLLLSNIMAPWESVHDFSSAYLRERIVEALKLAAEDDGAKDEFEVDEDATYRLAFSLETEGTFFTKLTGFQERDFAIVNPVMMPAPPREVPEEGEGDEPVEGSGDGDTGETGDATTP